MFAHQRKRVRLLFAIADALLTVAALEAAYWTRTQLTLDRVFFLNDRTHALLAAATALIFIYFGSRGRLYEELGSMRSHRLLGATARQVLLGGGMLILYEYLLRLDLSRSFLLLFLSYETILLALVRWQAPRILGIFEREFGAPYHVVLVGSEAKLRTLKRQLADSPFAIEVTEALDVADARHRIPQLLFAHVIDEVIFSVPGDALSDLESVFLLCDEQGVRTRVAVNFFPHVNSKISLDRFGEASLLTFSAAPSDELNLITKRAFDLLIASVALIALAPLMLVLAALIKLTSPGPVIYRQARCGLNGHRFTLYKFRSMVNDADEQRVHLEHLNERTIAFKLSQDPRVTSLGRFMRKYSIDEWPQFWNVVRGDMSLVGPRPPVPSEVERYERWQKRRLRMRPGLTCLWVLMGRDRLDFNSWMRADISYIDNWSLTLDWAILLKSIPHVLAGKGAH